MLHGLKDNHMDLFKNLLISIVAHGLKLSPRKMSAFHETFGIFRQCISHRRWSHNHHPYEK